jgi:hypothetical protein
VKPTTHLSASPVLPKNRARGEDKRRQIDRPRPLCRGIGTQITDRQTDKPPRFCNCTAASIADNPDRETRDFLANALDLEHVKRIRLRAHAAFEHAETDEPWLESPGQRRGRPVWSDFTAIFEILNAGLPVLEMSPAGSGSLPNWTGPATQRSSFAGARRRTEWLEVIPPPAATDGGRGATPGQLALIDIPERERRTVGSKVLNPAGILH